MHDAGEGSPYDVHAEIGQITDLVAPAPGEPVIVKNYPNSFVGTDLGYHPTVVASATATRQLSGLKTAMSSGWAGSLFSCVRYFRHETRRTP